MSPSERMIFISGQVALDGAGALVGEGDLAAQTRQALRNVGAALAAAGASFRDVVELTCFVRDGTQGAAVRKVCREFVDPVRPPESSFVAVSNLYHPDLLVEIEAVAVAPEAGGPMR